MSMTAQAQIPKEVYDEIASMNACSISDARGFESGLEHARRACAILTEHSVERCEPLRTAVELRATQYASIRSRAIPGHEIQERNAKMNEVLAAVGAAMRV